ncbi:hypothetical protein FKW77_010330 [Venturia effusa]|uniref:NmrA-like domain-containing protein n=1 Tax=Venturia effusa TaxID=50376 RepID=A0A517KXP5_9PEZI|nr:hypothetical protein FKW77_010330 [Venturia effusa]
MTTSLQFRNVALLASTGNLGSKILKSLVGAGFNVTAIQRAGSTKQVQAGIKAIQVDLSNKTDLSSAFKGQDAVVSAVPNPVLKTEKIMIDAAIEAGVKRVVLSEFSSNLEAKGKDVNLEIVKDKLEIRRYVEEAVKGTNTEWSSINNGPFLDLGVKMGFLGPNLRTKTATFHDGGDKLVCSTPTEDIGKAVALMLQKPAETKNKPVYVYSTLISERKMTDIVSKITGQEFKIQHADVQKDADAYLEDLKNGRKPANPWARFNLCMLMMYGEGYGGNYADTAMNETLGLRVMDDKELEEKVAEWLKE